ncbi:MAG: LLM class F420-dependent oxidoreductase [Proteobacteria bacterium]|nr:LLM class F420-dependent oxidoreductase [Pseudomonadota bacterium]
MRYGLTVFPSDDTIGPAALARAAEARGFDSLWVPEHSHFPVSPFTPGPDGDAGPPAMYYKILDPFVFLAAAAQASESLLLGTSVCLVVQRDPIQLAKQVASLDVLSGGRFQFGVGAGWHPLEMGNHGTAFDTRLALMGERIDAMKAIWTQERAEYHGEFVNFDPLYAWPKPAQKPHPPIWMGAQAPTGLRRVVAYGDGWFPVLAEENPGAVFDHLAALRERVERAGRDPDAFETSVYMCPPQADLVRRCQDEGIARAIFLLDPLPESACLEQLERLAELVGDVEAG